MRRKEKALWFVVPLMLFAVSAWCQERAPSKEAPASQESPNFMTDLRKSVVFIKVIFREGNEVKQVKGTGFFVFYEDKRLGENQGFGYLVTNRHVAEPDGKDGQLLPVLGSYVRFNLRNPIEGKASEEAKLPLDPTFKWYFPSDDAVDLAALPLLPDQKIIDYKTIPTSLFATKDRVQKERISEGDRVIFTGYFYNFPGINKIQPIVREGILAMMPEEKLITTRKKLGHLYLADVHVFGGNSGAPLFVNVGGLRSNGDLELVSGFPYLLLGVVSGYFHETQDFELEVATTLKGEVKGNSGVSAVVPVEELMLLLNSPELQRLRDQVVEQRTKK